MRPVIQTNDTTEIDPMNACRLLAHTNVYLSVGWAPLNCVESTGTVRGFVFFVDFPDADANGTNAQEVHDNVVPKAKEWLRTSSYGQLSLDITADTSQFYRMPEPASAYNWTSITAEMHAKYIEDALAAYGKALPEMDVLYVMAAPTAQALPNSQTSFFRPTTRSGDMVATKAVTTGIDVYESYKVFAHETGHTLCLPDYYPTDYENPLGYYVAGFSIMGDHREQAPDHFAWDKWRMGWLPDTAVDCVSQKGTTTHVLTALESTPGRGTQAVVVAASDTQALVAEVRTKSGVDDTLCGDASGVLLYTVDTLVPTGQGPVRVLDNSPTRWTCRYPANRGALSFDEGRSRSLTVDQFNVTVSLMAQEASGYYTIKVENL